MQMLLKLKMQRVVICALASKHLKIRSFLHHNLPISQHSRRGMTNLLSHCCPFLKMHSLSPYGEFQLSEMCWKQLNLSLCFLKLDLLDHTYYRRSFQVRLDLKRLIQDVEVAVAPKSNL